MSILEKIKDKKIKRYLTINKRIIYPGAIYHITQRAPGKEVLFNEDVDYLYFLKLLKETNMKFNLDLYCFALLPNHVHLLLKINKANLSFAMKNLFERYAAYFNIKYKRKGHVFCGRYRASLCNDNRYFLAISIYIHLNPYKAGLCKHYKIYKWSSVKLYTEHDKKTFVNFKGVLSLLSEDMHDAKRRYVEMMNNNIGKVKCEIEEKKSIKRDINILSKSVLKYVRSKDKEKEEKNMTEKFRHQSRIVNKQHRKARKQLIEELLSRGHSVEDIAENLSLSRMTIYRELK
jgi:putative transposase